MGTIDKTTVEAGLRFREFILALPSVGVAKVDEILQFLEISPRKKLGGLGVQQRLTAAAWLRDFSTRRKIIEVPHVVVLAGPTAVGKGTVAQEVLAHNPDIHLSVSATTRPARPGEVDGISYYFVSQDEFYRMIAAGELLEYATVHGQAMYGTPRAPVEAALAAGQSVLLEIDIQGARQVRASMPEARLVFLLPPSWDELVRRLNARGTETVEQKAQRLATAVIELAAQAEFDCRVVNADVSMAAQQVVDLLGINKE
ncbi:MAG: guanylate kinase [Actinomycetales bacterium]|nr:guanylate kinase [Actinomycetales bacterium]